MVDFAKIILYNTKENERSRECGVSLLHSWEVMHMLLEQAILQLVFLLFCELVIVTFVATFLFIALVIVIRKLNKKNTSLLDR